MQESTYLRLRVFKDGTNDNSIKGNIFKGSLGHAIDSTVWTLEAKDLG